MTTFFTSVYEGIKATSLVEWLAVISTIAYVILIAKKLIIAWLFAFVGAVLFVYLCYVGNLYIEALLQLFYVVMAIVGWLSWKKDTSDKIIIKTWKVNTHLLNIVISGMVSIIFGYIFDNYTNQANPYMDAFTTCYSLSATFMVAQKILENWIYWIVIDFVSIFLYAQRDYNLTAVQYVLFTILAIVGYIAWRKEYKTQKA